MTIFIVDLESVETRYTVQWKAGLPDSLRKFAKDAGKDVEVVNISGGDVQQVVTPGAFLNFAGTNQYKAQQCIAISNLFAEGKVKDGDQFLFTDAWNPVILQVKYMVELLGIKAELHAIWHSGSYDPQDFLGRLIKDKRWSNNTERAIFHALDYNIYATQFHIALFMQNVFPEVAPDSATANEYLGKVVLSGQPHDKLMDAILPFSGMKKRDLILFPHRVAPEKQPEIFRDLAKELPQFEFVICQESKLTKDQYHAMMGEAKIVFSANLQETLGISAMEAVMVDAIPLLPNRLSYTEMYAQDFLYPSVYTEDYASYERYKEELKQHICGLIEHYDNYVPALKRQRERLERDYLRATKMFEKLVN